MAEEEWREKESSQFLKDLELDASQIKHGRISPERMPEGVLVGLVSSPPSGNLKIVNAYIDPSEEELVLECL